MVVCPQCRTPYPDSETRCVRDGSALSAAAPITGEHDAPEDMLGELIGSYRIHKQLGKGGMGVVYQATHISLKREVAIKLLTGEGTQNEKTLERFYREAQSIAAITHPNIVHVFDFGCSPQGQPYLVMELLQGKTLYELQKTEQRFSPERTVSLILQLCDGLDAAHKAGIVHRDLKPENIFVIPDADGEILKLVDFGIAKRSDGMSKNLTGKNQLVGTPYYMSPEQSRAKEADPRSDLYSVGVILYEMLTGKVPFDGETSMDVFLKHITTAATPVCEVNPSIPAALGEVVMRLLSKEPNGRYESAGDLIKALEGVSTSSTAPVSIAPREPSRTTLNGSGEVIAAPVPVVKGKSILLVSVLAIVLGVSLTVLFMGAPPEAATATPQSAPTPTKKQEAPATVFVQPATTQAASVPASVPAVPEPKKGTKKKKEDGFFKGKEDL